MTRLPSKSKEQEKFFNIAAHNQDFAKKHGLDQKTATEWHNADKAKNASQTSQSKKTGK